MHLQFNRNSVFHFHDEDHSDAESEIQFQAHTENIDFNRTKFNVSWKSLHSNEADAVSHKVKTNNRLERLRESNKGFI